MGVESVVEGVDWKLSTKQLQVNTIPVVQYQVSRSFTQDTPPCVAALFVDGHESSGVLTVRASSTSSELELHG